MRTPLPICLLLLAIALPTPAQEDASALRNWFDDPFFRLTRDEADCPEPAGPFVDERGRREQAHRRAEKGTTCWLAGECDRPKAFDYDADIAAAIRADFARREAEFRPSSLWVSVQGRVVYFEGCAADAGMAARLETWARALPHVQQAIALLRVAQGAPPYRLR